MDSRSAEPNAGRRVAVVGAGAAGLVTAKTLLDAGVDVVVFEAGSQIGGTWVYGNDNGRAWIYRSLHINTAKRYTRFSDFDFEPGVPDFPSHADMHRYLVAYARRFGVEPRIHLRARVEAIEPVGGGRWHLRTNDTVEEFDAVVVCTSPFDRPRHAEDWRAHFKGRYLHAADYREPEPFVGKRVCILGAGNSAVDIASDVCSIAARTVMLSRSGVAIAPQYFFGRSFGELVVERLQRWWVPAAVRRALARLACHVVHGDVRRLGFRRPAHRVHPTISATIVADIVFGRVAVKQGLLSIEQRVVRFDDGTSEEFDVVIAATGYETRFPFLPAGAVELRDNRIDLYKRVVPPRAPGLYFVGMINLDTPINYACERQARWVAELISGRTKLPTAEAMDADIRAKQAWVEAHYGKAMRHTVQEESTRYYAEIEAELLRARYPRWIARLLAFFRGRPAVRR